MSPGYQIIRQSGFDDELSAVMGDIVRGDDFISGVEWTLSRNPEHGRQLSKHVWALQYGGNADTEVTVFYTLNTVKEEVYLLSVVKIEAE